jgi:hypothetical protein
MKECWVNIPDKRTSRFRLTICFALAAVIGFAAGSLLVLHNRGTSERIWRTLIKDHP